MGKRNMRKGGMKAKCPKCEDESKMGATPHNSPDWYTKEIIPQVGANFSVLTSLNPEPRLLTNGMYVNSLCLHYCVVTPGLDAHSSFHSKMLEFYTELRENNSGAANYAPVDVGAYVHNVVTLRMLLAHIRRALSAVRHANALYRESPGIFIAAAGFNSYTVESAAYAQNFNDYVLLCKDAEKLPICQLSMLDRMEFLFDKVFIDSQTTRPAMISFIPTNYFTAASSAPGSFAANYTFANVILPTANVGTATIANAIIAARNIYNLIIANQQNAIIRGDMLKAFGSGAMRNNLVSQVNNAYSVGYSADVASQLENASVQGLSVDVPGAVLTMSTTGGAATLTIGRRFATSAYILDEPRRIINFHGDSAPRDAALMAITRLAVTGTNGTNVVIDSTSGVTIGVTTFAIVSGGVTATLTNLDNCIDDSHSSIQSTSEAGYRRMLSLCTLIAHFPLVIHHPADPFGAFMDVDNAAYIAVDTLRDLTELANRSLYDIHLPRRSDGRIDRGSR